LQCTAKSYRYGAQGPLKCARGAVAALGRSPRPPRGPFAHQRAPQRFPIDTGGAGQVWAVPRTPRGGTCRSRHKSPRSIGRKRAVSRGGRCDRQPHGNRQRATDRVRAAVRSAALACHDLSGAISRSDLSGFRNSPLEGPEMKGGVLFLWIGPGPPPPRGPRRLRFWWEPGQFNLGFPGNGKIF
jgi:hypothetical protein